MYWFSTMLEFFLDILSLKERFRHLKSASDMVFPVLFNGTI